MKTAALIELLARGPVAVRAGAPGRRLAVAAALGTGLAAAAMLGVLGLRPDLAAAAQQAMFWLKLAFPAFLALAALAAATRLGRPGGRAGVALAAIAAASALVWAAALMQLLAATPQARGALIAGSTAWPCVAGIAALALPAWLALLFALRSLAPTRLRLAGAAAGLCAGAAAATVYALHCGEESLPFVAAWYVLGMLLPMAAGALASPRLLRWA